jgi:hypothetical protein
MQLAVAAVALGWPGCVDVKIITAIISAKSVMA